MEAMMRTWTEPVPGSIDPRPVFPPETVAPIESALAKVREAVMNSQRARQPQAQLRGIATPPQYNAQYATPPPQAMQPQYAQYGSQQVGVSPKRCSQVRELMIWQPTPQQHNYAYPPPPQHIANDVEAVRRDIDNLLPRFQYQVSTNPNDAGLQKQLGALHALRNLLATQQVSPFELQEIKSQVSRLAPALPQQPQANPQPAGPSPSWPYPQPSPSTFSNARPQPATAPPVLTPDAINGLQALLASTNKPSTPQMRSAMPGFQDAPHSQLSNIQHHAAAAPAANGTADLLSSLAKAGLIGPSLTPSSGAPSAAAQSAPFNPTESLLKSLQSVLPPKPNGGTPTQFRNQPTNVPLTAASLKVLRPELLYALYDAQPNQCSTCARRFLGTEEGRAKKSRHLDWHFRMNQRIADPNTNRGHHRNWFPDELEWIRHVEFDPSTTTATSTDTGLAAKAQKGPQDQFVRAPAGMTKNTCNICFEEMKSSYSEDLQDWIFANATYHNGKIVHGTCLAEMTKSQPPTMGGGALAAAIASVSGDQRERSATPDSVLGKRKAEAAVRGNGARVKLER